MSERLKSFIPTKQEKRIAQKEAKDAADAGLLSSSPASLPLSKSGSDSEAKVVIENDDNNNNNNITVDDHETKKRKDNNDSVNDNRTFTEISKMRQVVEQEIVKCHSGFSGHPYPCCEGKTPLMMKMTNGRKEKINVDLSLCTTSQLKKCVAAQSGLSHEAVRMIYHALPLINDARTLEQQKVTVGSTIHLILQMRGS